VKTNDEAGALELIKASRLQPQQAAPDFLLRKGDVPGHEFHGNQYHGGETAQKATVAASLASKKANSSNTEVDHTEAANAHDTAMRAQLTAQTNAARQGDRMNANAHKAEADFHREARNKHEAMAEEAQSQR
jgi:hypothetical protein